MFTTFFILLTFLSFSKCIPLQTMPTLSEVLIIPQIAVRCDYLFMQLNINEPGTWTVGQSISPCIQKNEIKENRNVDNEKIFNSLVSLCSLAYPQWNITSVAIAPWSVEISNACQAQNYYHQEQHCTQPEQPFSYRPYFCLDESINPVTTSLPVDSHCVALSTLPFTKCNTLQQLLQKANEHCKFNQFLSTLSAVLPFSMCLATESAVSSSSSSTSSSLSDNSFDNQLLYSAMRFVCCSSKSPSELVKSLREEESLYSRLWTNEHSPIGDAVLEEIDNRFRREYSDLMRRLTKEKSLLLLSEENKNRKKSHEQLLELTRMVDYVIQEPGANAGRISSAIRQFFDIVLNQLKRLQSLYGQFTEHHQEIITFLLEDFHFIRNEYIAVMQKMSDLESPNLFLTIHQQLQDDVGQVQRQLNDTQQLLSRSNDSDIAAKFHWTDEINKIINQAHQDYFFDWIKNSNSSSNRQTAHRDTTPEDKIQTFQRRFAIILIVDVVILILLIAICCCKSQYCWKICIKERRKCPLSPSSSSQGTVTSSSTASLSRSNLILHTEGFENPVFQYLNGEQHQQQRFVTTTTTTYDVAAAAP